MGRRGMVDALATWWQSAIDATLYAMRSYAPLLTWSEVLLWTTIMLLVGLLAGIRRHK